MHKIVEFDFKNTGRKNLKLKYTQYSLHTTIKFSNGYFFNISSLLLNKIYKPVNSFLKFIFETNVKKECVIVAKKRGMLVYNTLFVPIF